MSTPIVSSISGLEIYAPSAGFAPTNSADVSAIASGYQVVSAVGDDGTNVTSINSMPLSSQITVQLPITGATGDETSTYGGSVEYTRYDTAGEPDIRTATFDVDGLRITYTVDENDYTGMTANEAGIQFEDAGNYYEVAPYTISNWNNVYDHVNSASSNWTASGIDSATCSAIASAYAQSAVSSVSGEYYGTGNVSGFATTAYVDSAVSGVEISFDSSIATASSTAGVTASVNTAILSAYAYESSNSAKLDATAFSTVSGNFLTSQTVTALGDDGTYITSINGSALSGHGGGGASLPITGSAGDDTATYGVTGIEFTRNDTAGEPDIRTATLSPDQFYIDYTLDGIDHTSMMLTESMLDFGDSDGDHIVDAYSIDSWNSAVDTVSNNSASWGQGGVDSATVSAIASSYAESAVSSKLDTTAQVVSATAGDGTYVTSINGMGISGQGGGGGGGVVTATGSASATAGFFPITTSYLVSSINGSAILPFGYDTLSSNSAKWTSTTYTLSSNSAKWTSTNSAVSANSAKWTGTNSAVSANSANWNSAYSLISGVTALMDAI